MLFNSFRYFIISTLLVGLVLATSCDKYDDDEIPFAYVNFYINPNSSFYWQINSPGGWIYLVADTPSRGIIIYRGLQDDFKAYERTCPYDPYEACARVEVEPSGLTIADSCCGSRFIILDGSVIQGPSKRPLKQYRTSYDGNLLHVFN